MDLAKGEDLSTILRRRRGVPMPLDEALAILRPLASALDYAHGEHVLHRDVKPANVKVDGSRVQLLDFGLAAEVRSSMSRVSLRGHAGSSGTPAYMAPEQWEARRQSAATDQYSLAVMAYEMLSGYRPFDTDNMELLKSAVLTRAPEEIEGVPAYVNAALQKALAKNPKERFASCTEFVDAIASAKGDDESIAAHGNIVEESSMLLLSATVNNAGVSGATLSIWGQSIALPAKLELDSGTVFGPGNIEFRDGNGAVYAAEIGQLQVDWRGERAISVPLAALVRTASATKKHHKKPAVLAILIAIGVAIVAIVAIGLSREALRSKTGHSSVQAELFNTKGEDYFFGRNGCRQDDAEAVKWYRKAAELGNSTAQRHLGYMYANGRGVSQNDAEAVKLYRKAIKQGNVTAQTNLGYMYAEGRGVPQSNAEALKWYRKAAEQGDSSAQTNLGTMYADGRGVPQSDVEAVKWYRKAAEQGDSRAQCLLGSMYGLGRGVPEDRAEAVKWLRKAAEQGDESAKKMLQRVEPIVNILDLFGTK